MDTFDRSVQIGPEFFKKAFSDYNDKFWAFAREIMQNSMDAGSSKIDITIAENHQDGTTLVTITNNGVTMDDYLLTNKLLSLGSSGKDFKGAVGGFGKAKEILYFAHLDYEIRSGRYLVKGSGASYRIDPMPEMFWGTRSAVRWNGCYGDPLRLAFERFIHMCDVACKCKFTINGEKIRPKLKPDADAVRVLREDEGLKSDGQPWGDVRFANQMPGLVVVRIGRSPMFFTHTKYKRTIVIDLRGTSGSKLTSNRDALKYPYNGLLNEFVVQVSVDTSSAFKLEKAEIVRHAGPKLKAKIKPKETGEIQAEPEPDVDLIAQAAWAAERDGGAGIRVDVSASFERPVSILAHEFLTKNCVRRSIPAEFDPSGNDFSDHAHWIVRAYAGCLVELYELYQIPDTFSIGFIFDEETRAEWSQSNDYGQVYFINPCNVGKRRSTRAFSRFKRHEILATAIHEFVHGGMNRRYHDERYANDLTFVTAKVMANFRRFARHLN